MCGAKLQFRHKGVTPVRIYSLEADFAEQKATHMYIHIYVPIHIHIYIHIHTHAHVHIHIHIPILRYGDTAL